MVAKKKFDLKGYLKAQIEHARSCPHNRHGARVRFSVSDEELTDEMLLLTFTDSEGADWWREQNREKFMIEVEEEEE